MRIVPILFAALLSGMATAQAATPYEQAFAAYQKGDYPQALKLLKPLAEKGNVNAQYNVGVMYNEALGVKTDYAEAAKWFKLAAQQGNMYAEVDLGKLYESGRGVQKDYKEALQIGRASCRERVESCVCGGALMR